MGDQVEVFGDLKEGELVAKSGNEELLSGTRVKPNVEPAEDLPPVEEPPASNVRNPSGHQKTQADPAPIQGKPPTIQAQIRSRRRDGNEVESSLRLSLNRDEQEAAGTKGANNRRTESLNSLFRRLWRTYHY